MLTVKFQTKHLKSNICKHQSHKYTSNPNLLDNAADNDKLKAPSKFSHRLLQSVDNLTSKQLRQKGVFNIRGPLTHCRYDLM